MLAASLVLGGCAAFACRPATVRVLAKEERTRIVVEHGGVRTDEVGRVVEVERVHAVREYWVQADPGGWLPVPESAWRSAEPGQSLDLCR